MDDYEKKLLRRWEFWDVGAEQSPSTVIQDHCAEMAREVKLLLEDYRSFSKQQDAAQLARTDEELVEGLAKWFYLQDHPDREYDDGTTTKWVEWEKNVPVVMERYREKARAAIKSARKER
jgi:hypothetical protein